MPRDPASVVCALRSCRDLMTEISGRVTIGEPVYVAAHGITKAIDSMAFVLTGDRQYFWGVGGGATDGQIAKMADRAARERGELPWEP